MRVYTKEDVKHLRSAVNFIDFFQVVIIVTLSRALKDCMDHEQRGPLSATFRRPFHAKRKKNEIDHGCPRYNSVSFTPDSRRYSIIRINGEQFYSVEKYNLYVKELINWYLLFFREKGRNFFERETERDKFS